MAEAEAQFEVAPPAMLSSKMTAGPGAVAAGAAGPKLRLFFSPVKPCPRQLGAVLPPYMISVRGTIDAPALKLAVPPPELLPGVAKDVPLGGRPTRRGIYGIVTGSVVHRGRTRRESDAVAR
jgi:hypothetical protein